ncbi:hypothetical protein [Leucobacter sp. M11]|uniref:hypothetical protein n=1 Tax=Leucobacter sp. M11 TaxID=2993565 RepID=UPI002D7EE6E6|nr:hypothetical protein [Leucobacter sp. M11]MEB4614773.1 hypothetical protein [Leucobacter sp. M11]
MAPGSHSAPRHRAAAILVGILVVILAGVASPAAAEEPGAGPELLGADPAITVESEAAHPAADGDTQAAPVADEANPVGEPGTAPAIDESGPISTEQPAPASEPASVPEPVDTAPEADLAPAPDSASARLAERAALPAALDEPVLGAEAPELVLSGTAAVGQRLTVGPADTLGDWTIESVSWMFRHNVYQVQPVPNSRLEVVVPAHDGPGLGEGALGKQISATVLLARKIPGQMRPETKQVTLFSAPIERGKFTGLTVSLDEAPWRVGNTVKVTDYQTVPSVIPQIIWKRDGAQVATGTTSYSLTGEDLGSDISLHMVWSAAGYHELSVPVTNGVVQQGSFEPAAVTLSGTGETGLPLRARFDRDWSPAPDRTEFVWWAGAARIPGATGPEYTPTAADAGKAIRVSATAAQEFYVDAETAKSAPIEVWERADPTGELAVIGDPVMNGTLELNLKNWSGSGEISEIRWFSGTTELTGRTGPTLPLTADLVGTAVHATATITTERFHTVRLSTVPVTVAPAAMPSSFAEVRGELRYGNEVSLEVKFLQAIALGEAVTVVWNVNGIQHGTATYRPRIEDIGSVVTATYTLSAPGYSTSRRTLHVGRVEQGSQQVPDLRIIGDAVVGGSLAVRQEDTLPEDATITVESWTRDGQAIDDSAGTMRWVPRPEDLGSSLGAQVVVERPGYEARRVWATGPTILPGTLARGTVGVLGADGNRVEPGGVLRATHTGWDTPGTALSWEWQTANGTVLGTEETLPVTEAMLGERITLRASASAAGYTSVTSEAPVSGRPLVFAPRAYAIESQPRAGEDLVITGAHLTPGEPVRVRLTPGHAAPWLRASAADPIIATAVAGPAGTAQVTLRLPRTFSGAATLTIEPGGFRQELTVLEALPLVMTPGTVSVETDAGALGDRLEVGQRVSALAAGWDAPGSDLAYSWRTEAGRELGTGRELILTEEVLGERLSVRVTGSAPEYIPASVTSPLTPAVSLPRAFRVLGEARAGTELRLAGEHLTAGESVRALLTLRASGATVEASGTADADGTVRLALPVPAAAVGAATLTVEPGAFAQELTVLAATPVTPDPERPPVTEVTPDPERPTIVKTPPVPSRIPAGLPEPAATHPAPRLADTGTSESASGLLAMLLLLAGGLLLGVTGCASLRGGRLRSTEGRWARGRG